MSDRLLEAVERWDELGHLGQTVAMDYCDCDDCVAQTELREALDEAKEEE